MLIQREVGEQPFQPPVFFFELTEPAQFSRAQVGVFLLPGVEGRGTHPELPALACRIAYTICSSENFDRFIGLLLSCEAAEAVILL